MRCQGARRAPGRRRGGAAALEAARARAPGGSMRLPLPQGACWLLPAAAAADVAHNYLSHTLVLHRHKILGRTTRLQARLRSSRPARCAATPQLQGQLR